MNQIRHTTANRKPHKCNPAHYNGSYQKSQWKPPEPAREFQLFDLADEGGWTENDTDYWSVDSEGGNPRILGESPNRTTCRLARYRRDASTAPWHGYPITLRRQGEKIPPSDVLSRWFDGDRVLSRAWRRKIIQRQV